MSECMDVATFFMNFSEVSFSTFVFIAMPFAMSFTTFLSMSFSMDQR